MTISIILLVLLKIIDNDTELSHFPRERKIFKYPRSELPSLESEVSLKHVYAHIIEREFIFLE